VKLARFGGEPLLVPHVLLLEVQREDGVGAAGGRVQRRRRHVLASLPEVQHRLHVFVPGERKRERERERERKREKERERERDGKKQTQR
jgi:hypothetical protein